MVRQAHGPVVQPRPLGQRSGPPRHPQAAGTTVQSMDLYAPPIGPDPVGLENLDGGLLGGEACRERRCPTLGGPFALGSLVGREDPGLEPLAELVERRHHLRHVDEIDPHPVATLGRRAGKLGYHAASETRESLTWPIRRRVSPRSEGTTTSRGSTASTRKASGIGTRGKQMGAANTSPKTTIIR